jgi:hypothetical protein
LQHHAIAKDGRKLDVGLCRERKCAQREEQGDSPVKMSGRLFVHAT